MTFCSTVFQNSNFLRCKAGCSIKFFFYGGKVVKDFKRQKNIFLTRFVCIVLSLYLTEKDGWGGGNFQLPPNSVYALVKQHQLFYCGNESQFKIKRNNPVKIWKFKTFFHKFFKISHFLAVRFTESFPVKSFNFELWHIVFF